MAQCSVFSLQCKLHSLSTEKKQQRGMIHSEGALCIQGIALMQGDDKLA